MNIKVRGTINTTTESANFKKILSNSTHLNITYLMIWTNPHYEIDHLHRSITNKEVEFIIKKIPKSKPSIVCAFIGKFCQITAFREILRSFLQKICSENGRETLSNSFYEGTITVISKQEKENGQRENYRPISFMK